MEFPVCPICKGEEVCITYYGEIRNGGLGKYTTEKIKIYQCKHCGILWHDQLLKNYVGYYESQEYRLSIDEKAEAETFYQNHDKETFAKFRYTGTDIFRNKIVTDVGCGAGAFLDFLKGVAGKIVAIEPTQDFREILSRKGYSAYAYAEDAILEWKNTVDVVTSFDVIEHVADPAKFIKNIYDLLRQDGFAIIGTPTDAPIMRKLLGECFEKQLLFSTQHLWVFSGESLKRLAQSTGFSNIEIRYFQRYGITNLLGWCIEKRPQADIEDMAFTYELDAAWRSVSSAHQMADYVVLYAKK